MRTIPAFVLVLATAIALPTPSGAEDITALISQYRRDHGLPPVKTDDRLTAIAEHQARAMAESGIMDHSVAGPFSTRISGASLAEAAENVAAGTRTWEDTLRMWEKSPGHNRNLLTPRADLLGVAVARNENTHYKVYWAMVIGRRDAGRRGSKTVKSAAANAATPPADGASVGAWVSETITSIKNLLP